MGRRCAEAVAGRSGDWAPRNHLLGLAAPVSDTALEPQNANSAALWIALVQARSMNPLECICY